MSEEKDGFEVPLVRGERDLSAKRVEGLARWCDEEVSQLEGKQQRQCVGGEGLRAAAQLFPRAKTMGKALFFCDIAATLRALAKERDAGREDAAKAEGRLDRLQRRFMYITQGPKGYRAAARLGSALLYWWEQQSHLPALRDIGLALDRLGETPREDHIDKLRGEGNADHAD